MLFDMKCYNLKYFWQEKLIILHFIIYACAQKPRGYRAAPERVFPYLPNPKYIYYKFLFVYFIKLFTYAQTNE